MGFDALESGFIENLIDEIAREYGTRDVYQIAGKAGVSIIYESWHPATVGEFERKTKTIRVNRNAPGKAEDAENTQRKIVAHELGHFFAVDLKMDKKEEEKFSHSFAERLLENDG
ncbi:MAG: ImmA/IrrE family metallo-endopeptidase [Acidobacteriota bacterium]|nr:ImmA/IrrE family metallo-endopeptidase [Acidobacteriota bacterium]